MNRRLLTVLLIAFAIAGACTWMVYRIVGNRIVASKPVPTSRVVAAASDLKIGALIAASDLTSQSVSGAPPKGTFADPKDVIGRGVISQIYQGEQIMDNRLAPKGSGGGMAAKIPDGMRACAVKVDEVVGVSGFAGPGMRVDVLVSGTPPNQTGTSQGEMTSTVLQNIEVLSAGTDIQQDAEGKPKQVQVVNLLVTPEQAQKLSLASNLKIQLVLRNPLDTKISQVASTATSALFSAPSGTVASTGVQRPKKIVPEVFPIVITNGTATTVQKFSGGQH